MSVPEQPETDLISARTAARLAAVQALYQMDLAGTDLNDVIAEFMRERFDVQRGPDDEETDIASKKTDRLFFADILKGVLRRQREIDPLVDDQLATGWRLVRVDSILRAILRAGVAELLERADVPARVVINEYINVAHFFFSEDEPRVVNGVLDKIARKVRRQGIRSQARHGLDGLVILASSGSNAVTDRIKSETDLIQTYLAPLAAGAPGAFGLKDDAALISPEPGTDIVISTDPIRAGVHFFETDRADDIAWKALAVNISDIAAKGARPLAYTMALAFPEAPERAWMQSFADGLRAAQTEFGCHLIGGDTDHASGPLSISITAFGTVPRGRMVQRTTAKAGDHLFVTGTLGDAALGLAVHRDPAFLNRELTSGDRAFLSGRYLRPNPRVALAPLLLATASASLDISDGLLKDLGRMTAAAGVGATLRFEALPLSPPARHMIEAMPTFAADIVTGGGDYEILFAVPREKLETFRAIAPAIGVQVTEIGRLEAGGGVTLLDQSGQAMHFGRQGYDHFA